MNIVYATLIQLFCEHIHGCKSRVSFYLFCFFFLMSRNLIESKIWKVSTFAFHCGYQQETNSLVLQITLHEMLALPRTHCACVSIENHQNEISRKRANFDGHTNQCLLRWVSIRYWNIIHVYPFSSVCMGCLVMPSYILTCFIHIPIGILM